MPRFSPTTRIRRADGGIALHINAFLHRATSNSRSRARRLFPPTCTIDHARRPLKNTSYLAHSTPAHQFLPCREIEERAAAEKFHEKYSAHASPIKTTNFHQRRRSPDLPPSIIMHFPRRMKASPARILRLSAILFCRARRHKDFPGKIRLVSYSAHSARTTHMRARVSSTTRVSWSSSSSPRRPRACVGKPSDKLNRCVHVHRRDAINSVHRVLE